MEFLYYAPLRIDFGRNRISKIASYAARNGNRVLLVTGKNHLKQTGILDKIINSFKKSGKIEELIVFDKARENPNAELIDAASQIMNENSLNVVVAVGGGSSMDLAKAASISAKQKKPIWQLTKDPTISVCDAFPVVCSPTTSGSGSEVTKYAVINNDTEKLKIAIANEHIYPKVSLIDPTLTYTMSTQTTANTGFDALSHAVEAYTSNSSSPITDGYCRQAVSLVGDNLTKAYKKQEDAMDNMSLAAMFAGMALNVGRASLPHAMEHSLSAYKPDLPHGLGLSMVAVPFLKRITDCVPEKMADIAYLLGENIANCELKEAAFKAVEAVEKIKDSVGLNKKLSDFGFDKEVLEEMLDKTYQTMEHGIENSPCNFTKEDILNMYLEVL